MQADDRHFLKLRPRHWGSRQAAQCAACAYGVLNAWLAVTVAPRVAPEVRVNAVALCALESALWLFVSLGCFGGYCDMLGHKLNSMRALVASCSSLAFQVGFARMLGVSDQAAVVPLAMVCAIAPLCVLGLEHTMMYCSLLQAEQVREMRRVEVIFHYAVCLFVHIGAHLPNVARAARLSGGRVRTGVAGVAVLMTLPLALCWRWCAGRTTFERMDVASLVALFAAKAVFLESVS